LESSFITAGLGDGLLLAMASRSIKMLMHANLELFLSPVDRSTGEIATTSRAMAPTQK
jgi:hypothetical protein